MIENGSYKRCWPATARGELLGSLSDLQSGVKPEDEQVERIKQHLKEPELIK
jgi:hypothetical protein